MKVKLNQKKKIWNIYQNYWLKLPMILTVVCYKWEANTVSDRIWLIQGALNRARVNLWPHEYTQKWFKKIQGQARYCKRETLQKFFSLANQSACIIPIQDGAPDWQEGVVNGQGVGDTVVGFNPDGLYRETDQVAHYGHQLEVTHQPPRGCRDLQRVAERQVICVEVLRAAFVCGDSTLFCFVLFLEWFF